MLKIIAAETKEHFDLAKILFKEYASSLEFELDFQNFEGEIADIKEAYLEKRGCVLLAFLQWDIAGCVALRDIGDEICEMKRLYVKPPFRGMKLGRALAAAIIERARALGYEAMRLDTISTMQAAIHLYKSLGFREISPYRHNPVEGASYFELTLLK